MKAGDWAYIEARVKRMSTPAIAVVSIAGFPYPVQVTEDRVRDGRMWAEITRVDGDKVTLNVGAAHMVTIDESCILEAVTSASRPF